MSEWSGRLREMGHVFFGEAVITPVDRRQAIERAMQAQRLAYELDWRLHDLVVQIGPPEGAGRLLAVGPVTADED